MAIEGISALGGAEAQLGVGASRGTAGTDAKAAGGPSFTQVLGQVVNDAIGTMQAGEAAAIQGLQETTPPFKVVEAIMTAQRTLQQTLAIRDKAVAAYQEISRMAI